MARKMGLIVEGHDFQFTRNWFIGRNLPTFREFIHPEWAGKPITYLEIGVFQGQSMVWMMQRILTHPDSRAVGVDPWLQMPPKWDQTHMDDNMRMAFQNTEPWRDRCNLQRSTSIRMLRPMQKGLHGIGPGTLELCMIDGEHGALEMLTDARLVLPLMKKGGWILFDDVENTRPKTFHVKDGLAMFLKDFGDRLKRVFKHRHMEGFEVIK